MMNMLRKIASAALIIIIASCAAPAKKKEEIVFFPPDPELPRIQYLTYYTALKDIEEESSFDRFVVGELLNRRVDKPYGVGMYDGKIYVCDTNKTVIVFDLKEKKYGPLKGAKGKGKLIQPVNISIEEGGIKYVTDPIRNQVVAFDRNDEYLKAYGMATKWKPVDAAPFEDRLYVADMMNGAIRVFDKQSGEIVKSIGDSGEPKERLDRPTNLVFDRDGYLYVSDVGRFQVVKFDRDGRLISMFGKLGDSTGHFARPKGIAVDREGRLYAVDAAFDNVQIFNKNGRPLLFFGLQEPGPGNFQLPAKVVIDYNNLQYFQKYVQSNFEIEYLILVTSQVGDRAVNVLGYGHEKGKKYPTEEEILKSIEEKRQKELEKLEKIGVKDDDRQEKTETEGAGEAGSGAETTKPSAEPEGK
jgi:DNA-binding beta-propeller fold protein YncE